MKSTFFQRLIASTVLIGAVFGAASVAQARPDVQVLIGLPGLPGLPVLLPPPLPRPVIRVEPAYHSFWLDQSQVTSVPSVPSDPSVSFLHGASKEVVTMTGLEGIYL